MGTNILNGSGAMHFFVACSVIIWQQIRNMDVAMCAIVTHDGTNPDGIIIIVVVVVDIDIDIAAVDVAVAADIAVVFKN